MNRTKSSALRSIDISGTPQLFVFNIVVLIEPSHLKAWAQKRIKRRKKTDKIADISFQNANVANQILDTDIPHARKHIQFEWGVYRTVLILCLRYNFDTQISMLCYTILFHSTQLLSIHTHTHTHTRSVPRSFSQIKSVKHQFFFQFACFRLARAHSIFILAAATMLSPLLDFSCHHIKIFQLLSINM